MGHLHRFAPALVLAMGGLIAGCGDDTVRAGGSEPTTTAAPDRLALEDLVATCGGNTFPSLPADWTQWPPFDERDAIDLTAIGGPSGGEGQFFFEEFYDRYDWFESARTDASINLFGYPRDGEIAGDDPQFAGLYMEPAGARWSPRSWGDCRIELAAPGWGNTDFVLDPAVPPEPAATTVAVQVTERACASGQPPTGRAISSVVVSADRESVSVAVLVEPPIGDQTCPGNPSVPFVVDLGEPLGDRVVLDAGTSPPDPVGSGQG